MEQFWWASDIYPGQTKTIRKVLGWISKDKSHPIGIVPGCDLGGHRRVPCVQAWWLERQEPCSSFVNVIVFSLVRKEQRSVLDWKMIPQQKL